MADVWRWGLIPAAVIVAWGVIGLWRDEADMRRRGDPRAEPMWVCIVGFVVMTTLWPLMVLAFMVKVGRAVLRG